ncbi:hypothetical protein CP981_19625 [Streptomyces platensis]|uniref:Uncharacterized protein n=1 Tax=Streptomyces platensis TaxID=58346 RepID=A0AAE6TR78_STRPT|nr:hypothetical protein CP981_19625 [Streptomyces platensis]
MGPESSVHILGRGKLSLWDPQAGVLTGHRRRSAACGFVANLLPQGVDSGFVHRAAAVLSTARPQASRCCPQQSPASPHRCPLFGNTTPALTGPSESRHTKVVGWAVGNVGKAGDGTGEKYLSPVHRVCRTFGGPQNRPLIHGRHPQGRWTKNPR